MAWILAGYDNYSQPVWGQTDPNDTSHPPFSGEPGSAASGIIVTPSTQPDTPPLATVTVGSLAEVPVDTRSTFIEGHRFFYDHVTGTIEYPAYLTAHQIHLLLDKYPTAGGGLPHPFDPEDPAQYCAFHDCGEDLLFGFLPRGTFAALGLTAAAVVPFALAATATGAVASIGGSLAGGAVGRAVGGAVGGDTGALVGGLVGAVGGGSAGLAAGNAYLPAEAAAGLGDIGAQTPVDPVYFGFDAPLAPAASGFEPYTIASDLVAGNPASALIPQLDFTPIQSGDLIRYSPPTAPDGSLSWADARSALNTAKTAAGLALAVQTITNDPAARATVKPVVFRASENLGSLAGWYDSGPVAADPDPAVALPVFESGGAVGLLIPAALGGLLYYTLIAR